MDSGRFHKTGDRASDICPLGVRTTQGGPVCDAIGSSRRHLDLCPRRWLSHRRDRIAEEYPTDKRHLSGPLRICDQGSFFVAGRAKITPVRQTPLRQLLPELIITQMYVQFQVPPNARGGRSSWCTEAAIQGQFGVDSGGREGVVLRSGGRGLATYVVDQAGRGRSGFDRSFINESIAPATWPVSNLGNTSSSGIWTAWFGFIVPPARTSSRAP